MQWLAVGMGAALGACLRAWLSRFNRSSYFYHWLPMGTLMANVLGGLLIGMALAVFLRFGDTLHPNIRLFVVTGFLGGLTTFSSFSAEVFELLTDGRIAVGFGLIGLHVILTLLATALGFYTMRMLITYLV